MKLSAQRRVTILPSEPKDSLLSSRLISSLLLWLVRFYTIKRLNDVVPFSATELDVSPDNSTSCYIK